MIAQQDTTPSSGHPALSELLALRGHALAPGEVTITGHDPFYKGPFKIGETVAAVLAAIGVAANDLWQARTGRRQRIAIDTARAAATVRTSDYSQIRNPNGSFRQIAPSAGFAHMLTITQPWRTRDGRYFLPHLNLPHLHDRVLGVLGCESTVEGVSGAVAVRDADELDEAIAVARACGGVVRTADQWRAHPQGRLLAHRPVVSVDRIGDTPAEPLLQGTRPLSGIRVLDLTRILAGPIAGRTLAEHGADVLMVTAEHLPQVPDHVRDTSHGKRSCFVDLRTPEGREQLAELVRQADVFVNGYRPGEMEKFGFGTADLARLRPGIVVASVSCYGPEGPLAERAGWEQVAQCVTGIAHTNGERLAAGQPKLVFQPVCDYTTGYLTAYGIMLALGRRVREGGSFHVQASLCQSGMFLQRQGLVDDFAAAPGQLDESAALDASIKVETVYGHLRVLGPVLEMSETPPRWDRPTPRLGSHLLDWAAS